MDVETGLDQSSAFATTCIGMRRTTMFRSTTDRIYDGSPILEHYVI